MKYAIIDDDELTRMLVRSQLESLEIEVMEFTDARELEVFLENSSDPEAFTFLFDINLPNEDGDLFVQRRKELILKNPENQVIFLCADQRSLRLEIENEPNLMSVDKRELVFEIKRRSAR